MTVVKVTSWTEFSRMNVLSTSYSASGQITGTSITPFENSFSLSNSRTTELSEPGWRDRIRRHVSATTDLHGVERVVVPATLDCSTRIWTGFSPGLTSDLNRLVGERLVVGAPYGIDGSLDAEADNRAQIGFYKKAKAATQAFSTGTALGELCETMRMITNPAKSLRKSIPKYVRDLKKGTAHLGPRDKSKVLAETYLEWAFGVQPLLGDIDDGARALADLSTRDLADYVPITSVGQAGSMDASQVTPASIYSPTLQFLLLDTYYRNTMVRYKGEVRVGFDSPGGNLKYVGISLDDFVPTLWEVLPWSFLIDYFTNIGDVLASWSYATKNIAWCNKTTRRLSTLRRDWQLDVAAIRSYFGPYFIASTGSTSPAYTVDKTVDRGSGFPGFPSIMLRLPFGSTKWLNIAALARLSFSSKLS